MQPNNYGQQQHHSNNNAPQSQGGYGHQQNNNQRSNILDRGRIRVPRKFIPKKQDGQQVYYQGTQTPVMTPLYKTIGEVTRFQTQTGHFDKVEMYPGETILDSFNEGMIDWDSQNQNNNNQRG